MGLLKLGSLYKKKNKKEAPISRPPVPAPVPKLQPISLELNLDLNNSSSIHDTNTIKATTLPQQQKNNRNMNAPAGSGSFFDDIFSELTTTSTSKDPVTQQDSIQNEISLAAALSQQLELEENNSTNGMTGTTKKGSNAMSSSNKNEASSNASNFLLGGDSIYSSYLRNISALDGEQSNPTFSTSMFDSLLGNSRTTPTNTATNNNAASNIINNTPIATKVVLDSDVSDSDEDSQNDSEDDNSQLLNNDGNQRMTKGVRPIMERRAQDNRLLVQRKIDSWANRVDPEANRVESNESMINRMKDRHRNQVKLAALRQQQQDQQQQQQQQYNMMPHHMVTQPYGPAAIPLSPNVVLPHPGMLMDPAQIYYSTPLNDYPETPGSVPTHTQAKTQSMPPVPLPVGFLPNPTHATLAIPHKEKEEKEEKDQHATVVERQSMIQPSFPTRSYSTPTNPGHPKSSRSPPAMPLPSATMPPSVNSSFSSSDVNLNTQTLEPSPASSSITLQSTPSSLPTDTGDDNIADNKSVIVESPIQENMKPTIEDETFGEEADAESSDDEERKSVILRKKKSMKKLRQKQQQQQQQQETPSVGDTSNSNQSHHDNRHIRSSRSAPNLKKKQSSKKAGKSTSRSSSRRNSQETCTPPSEFITTPPPLPINHEEEHHYHLPRSYSHQQMHQPQPQQQQQPLPQHHHHQHYQQQNTQHQRQSLRRMKSEPDLPRTSQYLPAQQQQLSNEWERMQLHQREQQLKKHYYQSSNNNLPVVSSNYQQQPRPYMPMYSSPVYYNAMPPPMMPYSGSNGMEPYSPQQDVAHRASMMSGYNAMVYQQQQSSQGYYHPSNR